MTTIRRETENARDFLLTHASHSIASGGNLTGLSLHDENMVVAIAQRYTAHVILYVRQTHQEAAVTLKQYNPY